MELDIYTTKDIRSNAIFSPPELEWVKKSDHESIVDGLKITLDTDLNYQGAIADCDAYEVEIAELKLQINNLKYVQSTGYKHDADVIRNMVAEFIKEDESLSLNHFFRDIRIFQYADNLEKSE